MTLCVGLSEDFEKYLTAESIKVVSEDKYKDLIILLNSAYEDYKLRKRYSTALEKSKAIQERAWEILNTGQWCEVPFPPRKIYALACLIKICCLLRLGVTGDLLSVLTDALSATDDGLLLGYGLKKELTTIASKLSDVLHSEWLKSRRDATVLDSLEYKEKPGDWDFPGIKGETVNSLYCPSLEAFSFALFNPRLPAKLIDCIRHWPALTKWKDIGYLLRIGGGRKVPIEIGSQYTQSDWSMKLCTLREFITDHIMDKKSEVAYLAQHQLFNQVPELNDDIRIPEYCCMSETEEYPNVDINAWFGPKGTVSPLHHDPKHNLLTQVVGRKRILLFSPECSPNMYPFEGKLLSNTSEVDPENPDYDKHPDFAKAVCYECHLYPGEMLYIPPKWWHHVRSIDVSFSVSFWWT